jgi:acyl transferase domain-containing protein/NADP-dependent 3-hydroxy acid dehydrogenase YdfG/acyl carrier protein
MDLESRIKRVLVTVLRSSDTGTGPAPDLDAGFIDLGVNSLGSVAVVELLNEELDLSLGVEVMYDCLDVAELAALIREQYGDHVGVDEPAAAPALADPIAVATVGEVRDADVAVIGMSGRFAGAPDLDRFWRLLEAGSSSVREIQRPGWDEADYYDRDPRRTDRSISKWGGLLDDVDVFDPRFFGISPAEAEYLDPQQRLFLQESYRAFEDAGYAPDSLSGARVGVYVGARGSGYKDQAVRAGVLNSQVFLGTDMAILGARISYFLNLKGPTLTVDTACSSALVAMHLAVQSIRRGESDVALAGGVFVLDSPEFYVLTSQTNMLSPDGACKTFDDDANGIAVGEGVGAVVLKSLRAALADGDHIHGVIRGSAINQDGRTKGITAPSARSQQGLLHEAYADAGVDPGTVGYLEAHGTGTKLGDPIEVNALREAFRRYTDRTGFCALGSHKGNFGHTIMTAGIAGVFKSLLAMRHGKIPASPHVRELNRHLNLDDSPFYVNTRLREWQRPAGHPRRAGVSAFGFSGTNAHVVLEEAPPRPAATGTGGPHLFPLSARDPEALRRRVDDLLAWLETAGPDAPLADVAYTLAVGRTHFAHRTAVVATTAAELADALRGTGPAAHTGNGAADLHAAAARYLAGGDFDWAELYPGGGHHGRVSLPAYPFAGERYWIGGGPGAAAEAGTDVADGAVLLRPTWAPAGAATGEPPATRLVFAAPSVPDLDGEHLRLTGVEDGAVRIAARLRDLPRGGAPVLVQLAVPADGPERLLGGLLGLLLSAGHEHPGIRAQLVEVDAGADPRTVAAWLAQAAALLPATHVRATAHGLRTERWESVPDVAAPPIWREDGVYLITGGGGGLGRVLLADIAGRLGTATVVLAGRSATGDDPVAPHPGIHVEYRQADVTDPAAVRALVRDILAAHGRLTGVIHAAGVVHDGLLAGTTDEQLRAVLAPKVAGTVHLDEATRELPLDFFVLFGSITGPLGILGRSGYAAANAYLDRFAEHRSALVARGERHGRTVAVDWPVWAGGGMRVAAETLAAMRRTTGFAPMATAAGLRALHLALAGDAPQVLVASGDIARIRTLLPAPEHAVPAVPAAPMPTGPTLVPSPEPVLVPSPQPAAGVAVLTADMAARLLWEVTALAARFLRVSPDELDPDADLHIHGFDSITLTAFTNRLNDTYGLDLTPPILFEHITLGRLCGYLTGSYAGVFVARWAPATPVPVTQPVPVATVPARPRPAEPAGTGAPIAVIGMSGTFPKAPDVAALWANLLAGTDAVGAGLDARWGARAGAATEFPWAGLIDGIEEFDAAFFGISPYEAQQMDPQQRLLMTYAWKALEDAGYAPGSLAGSDTGLFVATFDSGYGYQGGDDTVEAHTAIGRTPSLGPNRFSYHLDLHGPSEPVETACSSSLVAIHRAVAALQQGECDLAIAGGVNVLVEPTTHTSLAKAGLLSPEGRCRTFSARADGFVRGEGSGMLVLKPLDRAERDGDQIYGLIRATAVNHGGRAQSLTAPNPRAQADLLVRAYRRAGVDPATVGYIEAHGTGTKLGDPIEINGLRSAFEQLYADTGRAPATRPHCGLGSIKSAIGHLELAAGVAGVIKVLMQLRRRTLVASLHTQPPNPYIDLHGSPFYVVEETRPWPAPLDADGRAQPRRAGVSSFGIGGVNAHAVLEEYTPATPPAPDGEPVLVVLSARTPQRLREQARQLLDFVRDGECTDADLPSLAYTLQVGRDAMDCRLAVPVASLPALTGALEAFLDGDDIPGLHHAEIDQHRDAVALIAGDEDLLAAARRWAQRRDRDKLPRWWVRGLDVDWAAMYGDTPPRRMSLPTYPFGTTAAAVAGAARPEPAPAAAPSYLGAVQQHLAAAFRNSSIDGTE